MSSHTLSFETQNIKQKAREAFEHLERSEVVNLDEEQISNLTRVKKVINVLRLKLDSVDPDLLSLDIITNLANYLNNIYAECVAFCSNKNFGHISNASSYLDQLLNTARLQIVLGSDSDHAAAANAVTSSHEKSLELLRKCTESISELKVRVDEYHQATEQGRVRLQEHDKGIETQKLRLDQAIANFQQQFSAQEAQRTAEFSANINNFLQQFAASQKEFSGKFEQALVNQTDEFKIHLIGVKDQSTEHQNFLDKRKSEVDEMFGAIGQGLRAGHFAKTADTERSSANLFRWISLGLMTAMIVAAGFTYYYSLTHGEIDWKVLLLRFGTTIVIAIPAVYAAQESSKHRDREKKLRKLHLELASIDSYLALLPLDTQHKLKSDLTAKFFGQVDLEIKDSDLTKNPLFDLIKITLENLTKSK